MEVARWAPITTPSALPVIWSRGMTALRRVSSAIGVVGIDEESDCLPLNLVIDRRSDEVELLGVQHGMG